MTKSERSFKLYSRLAELGFTYEESKALYRAQLTLHRWAEAECNGEIERDETTNKPARHFRWSAFGQGPGLSHQAFPIADREAGALRRVKGIVEARNARLGKGLNGAPDDFILPYHQTDPRGCALYLVKQSDLGNGCSPSLPLSSYYTRGLAVCI